jgi:hypothetical protein
VALDNIRYKVYISYNIEFLRFRVAEMGPNDLKLMQQRFRNVSVITARNAQRDRLNELGTEPFVVENGQTLTTFYSINRLKDVDDRRGKNHCGSGTQDQCYITLFVDVVVESTSCLL